MARDTRYDEQLASPKKKRKPAPRAADLAPSERAGMSQKAMEPEPPRVKMPPQEKPEDIKRPSDMMEERAAAKEKSKTLGESLVEVSGVMPQGTGKISRALKAGLSGAAVGATLGETLARLQQEKQAAEAEKKKPTRPEAKGVSDRAMDMDKEEDETDDGKRNPKRKRR